MTIPWYVSAFGESYPDLYHHRNASDARLAVDFARNHPQIAPLMCKPGRVLDLCCGAGRHGLAWCAAAPEANLVGLDLSSHLLRDAVQAFRHAGVSVALARGDMRFLPFLDGSFRLVLNLFTSFGYFENDSENADVLREVARVMEPAGGVFLFDHLNPSALRAGLVGESRRQTPSGAWVRETRWIDEARHRVEKRIEFDPEAERSPVRESVRFYEPEEIRTLAEQSRMRLLSVHGGWDATPLTAQSPRAVYVFQKIAS